MQPVHSDIFSDNSPEFIRNLSLFGLGVGLLMLSFNWWAFAKIDKERKLHHELQHEMVAIEQQLSLALMSERAYITTLMERKVPRQVEERDSELEVVFKDYRLIADRFPVREEMDNLNQATAGLLEGRRGCQQWRREYNASALSEAGAYDRLTGSLDLFLAEIRTLAKSLREGDGWAARLVGLQQEAAGFGLIIDRLRNETNIHYLQSIKNTELAPLFLEVRERVASLGEGEGPVSHQLGILFDGFAKELWGEGLQTDPGRMTIIPGTGGFLNENRERASLENERENIIEEMNGQFLAVRGARNRLINRIAEFVELESSKVEQTVNRSWKLVLLLNLILGCLFLFFARKLILLSRKRIAELNMVHGELRRSHAQLDMLFNAVANGMRVIDPNGKVIRVNDSFVALSGVAKEKLEGGNCYEYFSGAVCHTPECPLQLLAEGRNGLELEVEKKRQDGQTISCLLKATAVHGDKGELLAVIEDFSDISDIKQAEESLLKAKEAAEAANEAKSKFLANMSHEIRTPLNGIIGMTDLVLEMNISHEQRRFLEMVKTSADRLLDVVNEVLDFSKIEAGKLEIEEIPFSLADAVDNALKIMAVKAHEKGLDLAYHIAHEIPDAVVGDPGRLRQILINLVGNSIKFTEKGEVLVTVMGVEGVDARPAEGPGQGGASLRLLFSVTDTGIGIPPDKQQKIFEAFNQADGTTTRKYGGTGLGLTICAKMVALMGGDIWLESEPGKSTTFHFTIALRRRLNVPADPDMVAKGTLQNLSFLVVGDYTSSSMILKEMLQLWSKEVLVVNGKDEAVFLAGQRPFDVILLDTQMANQDPFVLLQGLRAVCGRAKLIFLTAAGRRGDAARCEEIGIDAYLLKPVSKKELLDAIRTALSRPARSEAPVTSLITRHTIREQQRKIHILLAEDEEINRTLVVELIQAEQDWRVSTAENGKKVLQALENDDFHLILMDIQMPEMDGLETTARIREMEQRTGGHIPIIALTAHALPQDRERCLAVGMDGYVSKPIDRNALVAEIGRLLGTKPCSRSKTFTPGLTGNTPIDYEVFLNGCCNGKEELARKLLGHLLNQSGPAWLAEAEAGVKERDARRIRKVCHSLKGTAATIGVFPFSEAGDRLGRLAREGRLDETPGALAQLKEEFVKIQEWARRNRIDLN